MRAPAVENRRRARANLSAVIPGRRSAPGPESITTACAYGFWARATYVARPGMTADVRCPSCAIPIFRLKEMAERRRQMEIAVLTPASAGLWFETLSGAPSAEDVGRVAVLLEGGPLRPHLRMVAQRQGGPFGRLAARAEDGRIRLWNPDFDAATPPDDMQAAMRLLIGRVAAIRQEAGLAHLAIENRPGDDLLHNDLWL